MADDRTEGNDQDSRAGGYGGSNPIPDEQQGQEQGGDASAVGRDNPSKSTVDADEAIGNRTGGYGGWGDDQDQGQAGK